MTEARSAIPTVTFVDEYCQLYQDLFPDVRSFEHFKQIQSGMLSEMKRKTLPAIAKAAGKSDPQVHLVQSDVACVLFRETVGASRYADRRIVTGTLQELIDGAEVFLSRYIAVGPGWKGLSG